MVTREEKLLAIFEKIQASADGCWLWQGSLAHGYGKVWLDGRKSSVHRILFQHFGGLLPKDTEIDHLCRVLRCVNPTHLEAVSHRVNVLSGAGIAAINAARTECTKGHLFDARNTYWRAGRTRQCRKCKATAAAVARHKKRQRIEAAA